MNAWPESIAFIMKWETGGDPDGGLTRDPVDPGGTTRWGISQRAHPDVDVEHLSQEAAQAIYHRSYWIPIRGPQLPGPVALATFDWAVHSGVRMAVMRLQRIVGADLDGIVGPITVQKIMAYKPPNGLTPSIRLATELTIARARQQAQLVINQPTMLKYLAGWTSRLIELTATFSWLRD